MQSDTVIALGKLIVSPVHEEDLLELQKSLVIRYRWEDEIKGFRIPAGYIFDGASIPVLQSDFKPRYLRAACIHDYFCDAWNKRKDSPVDFTVEEMSEIFGEILKLDGVSYLRAELMEAAVTIYKSLV